MIQTGTILKVIDKSSVVLVRCIKVLGSTNKRIAHLGDIILVSVIWHDANRFCRLKPRLRKKYGLGTMHRCLIVRTKVNFCRFPGIFIKFDENSVVIINKRFVPVTNRVYGPILREFCMRWPSLGCVTKYMI